MLLKVNFSQKSKSACLTKIILSQKQKYITLLVRGPNIPKNVSNYRAAKNSKCISLIPYMFIFCKNVFLTLFKTLCECHWQNTENVVTVDTRAIIKRTILQLSSLFI